MDRFGDRMKKYENAFRINLPGRMPVILRIDGRSFHTYTKDFIKPFDEELANAFWETSKYLAQNIMGAKLVYHQSDEISILLTNYDKLSTQSWFENNIQKLTSVSASLATAKFNDIMKNNHSCNSLATFDSRAWVLPHDEVCNYFLWRQHDATKNSVSMVARANFSHNQLQGLNSSQLQDKLMLEKNINWADIPVWQKRGVCIKKTPFIRNGTTRLKWDVDHNTPVFSQDRAYIEQYVFLDRSA